MTSDASGLSWLHIGDLHLARAGEANHRVLERIVALAAALPAGAVDFVLLPGDNADDGTPEQFELARDTLASLAVPLHVIPGDHDIAAGSLDAFRRILGTRALPYAETINGCRCLFLDVVSAGSGGPDFRIAPGQLAWCADELRQASGSGLAAAVFMHTYPADLREGAAPLRHLLAEWNVACVDMGHTHYNELANDGRTVFMATRSTGQIEEGPPGFSVAAVEDGVVSWRFKEIAHAWPFVLITQPVDRRLATSRHEAVDGAVAVRAKVLSDAPLVSVEASTGDGTWVAMRPVPGATASWTATLDAAAGRVTVRARDANGRQDAETIEPWRAGTPLPVRIADASDRDAVGAWPEKGILGTQLGPNRNGRKW